MGLTRHVGNGLVVATWLGVVEDSRSYNGFGELTERTVTSSAIPSLQVKYIRDKLGRIVGRTETVAAAPSEASTYTYDASGRLTEVGRGGGSVERYSYDANGNRASATTLAGTTTYTYDAQDRLLEAASPGGGDHLHLYGCRRIARREWDCWRGHIRL